MRKIFWENPYQHTLTTNITAVNGDEILLAETIAYSFSGGQESDKVFINGLLVLNSRMEGPLIYYTVSKGHGFSIGQEINMTIDWPRRYRLMRLHFAAELVLEIVTQKFLYEKVGAHIAEHKARIDFICPENISSIFTLILNDYNQIIRDNKKIHTGFSDVQKQRRYWKIDGFAEVPCGGTHVKSTAEVGFISLKRERPGKGIERIEIRLVDDSIARQ